MVALEKARYPSHPNVDESLFGTASGRHRSAANRNAGKTIAAQRMVSKNDIARMKVGLRCTSPLPIVLKPCRKMQLL